MSNKSPTCRTHSAGQSPTPSPHRSSPSPHRSIEDQISTEHFFQLIHHLGKHVIIVVLSVIFGIFSGLTSTSIAQFFFRLILLILSFYLINFIFYKKGARVISETFLIAFCVISCVYFIVSCPFLFFIPCLFFCAICSYLYYIL